MSTLIAAGVCWVVFLSRMNTLPPAAMAVVMMAAMMLPSAVPLVVGQAARPRTALAVIVIYLVIWCVIGMPAFLFANMLPTAPIALAIVAVVAALAYGFTPLHHASRERCRALCGEQRPALQLGFSYGLSCVGCSAGVMAALFVIDPMNPVWMLLASAVVAAYKLPRNFAMVRTG